MRAYWPATRNGRSGTCARGDPGHRQRQRVDRLGDVHRAGARHVRRGPGTGPSSAHSTLTVPWSYWKRRSPSRTRCGRCSSADEPLVELRGADGGEHRAARGVLAPVGRAHAAARPPRSDHALDRHAALDPAAGRRQPPHERVGQRARAALGHGEADRLRHADEHQPVDRAARGLRRVVGVQGVAANSSAGPSPANSSSTKRRTGSAPSRANSPMRRGVASAAPSFSARARAGTAA